MKRYIELIHKLTKNENRTFFCHKIVGVLTTISCINTSECNGKITQEQIPYIFLLILQYIILRVNINCKRHRW